MPASPKSLSLATTSVLPPSGVARPSILSCPKNSPPVVQFGQQRPEVQLQRLGCDGDAKGPELVDGGRVAADADQRLDGLAVQLQSARVGAVHTAGHVGAGPHIGGIGDVSDVDLLVATGLQLAIALVDEK